MAIKICNHCLYPETKPDLEFDENGVCSACLAYDKRAGINWDERGQEFLELIEEYRRDDDDNYDCVIPVSGGKDSTFARLYVYFKRE